MGTIHLIDLTVDDSGFFSCFWIIYTSETFSPHHAAISEGDKAARVFADVMSECIGWL